MSAEGDTGRPPAEPAAQAGRTADVRPPRAAGLGDVRGALAIGGAALFTPPVLFLADRESTVLGVPILVVYVFGAWLTGIVFTFLSARSGGSSGER